VIIIFFVVPVIGITNNGVKGDYYIFNSFGEIDSLNLNYTKTHDRSKDKYLKDMKPINSYLGEIEFQGKDFTFFVYEFSSVIDAKQYFKNITGKNIDRDSGFSESGNYYFSNRTIVYKDNKAYYIRGGYYKDYIRLIKFINNSFSDSIKG